ncbi:hypothetical protein BLOT_015941 [Blomia tropicalis]|nr:hypothetical protein BLOT_015941 [Blomia tropicalis]
MVFYDLDFSSPVVQVESIHLINSAMFHPNQGIDAMIKRKEKNVVKYKSKIQSTLHITHIMYKCNSFFILITKPETCSII